MVGGRRAAVALGGGLGALARALTDGLAPAPLVTLAINVAGALLLGLVLARVRNPLLRAGLGTGALGAWTTFSTLMVQLDGMLDGTPLLALALASASLLGGLAAARLGLARTPHDGTSA